MLHSADVAAPPAQRALDTSHLHCRQALPKAVKHKLDQMRASSFKLGPVCRREDAVRSELSGTPWDELGVDVGDRLQGRGEQVAHPTPWCASKVGV